MRLPITGSAGRGRSSTETTGSSLSSWIASTSSLVEAARDDHEVGDEDPVGVQVAGHDVARLGRAGDEHAGVGLDRRNRRAAAVEDHELRLALGRECCAREHVRLAGRPGEAAAAAPAADRDDAGERGRLEVVRGSVPPSARELEQRLERRLHLGHLRLGRAAAAHRDHDHVAVEREQPRDVAGDGGLADALAGPDDRQRRQRKRRERRRLEAEVRADVWQAEREHAARESHPLARPEHGLVREIDHELRLELDDRTLERVHDGDAVVVAAAQLLRPARKPEPDHLVRERRQRVAHDGRVVLAVADRESSHVLAVTSSSIRVVYFSNARVSVENWMIRSWPWNGYLRQTSTWRSVTSITL